MFRQTLKRAPHTCRHLSSTASSEKLTKSKDKWNAFIYLAEEGKQQQEQNHDFGGKDKDKGKGKGKLEGIKVGVKDMFCTTDMPTTCGSKMLEGYYSPFDATVVKILKDEGANIVGKTNMDEFGMGSQNIHSYFGPVINPSGPEWSSSSKSESSPSLKRNIKPRPRVAGGSSGGSAAAVAGGMCEIALSTDTGGSTRLPASHVGILGFKPSYGLLSRWGLVGYGSSLDTVGIMGKEIGIGRGRERGREEEKVGKGVGVAGVFDLLERHDPLDPTSVPESIRARSGLRTSKPQQQRKQQRSPLSQNQEQVKKDNKDRKRERERIFPLRDDGKPDLRGLRVGIPKEAFPSLSTATSTSSTSPTLPTLRSSLSHLLSLGATLHSISLPNTKSLTALSSYYVIVCSEAGSNLARFEGVEFGYRHPFDTHPHPYSHSLPLPSQKHNITSTNPNPNHEHHHQQPQQQQQPKMFSMTRSEGFGNEVKKRILLGTYALSAEAFDNYFLQAQKIRSLIRKDFDKVFRDFNPLNYDYNPSSSIDEMRMREKEVLLRERNEEGEERKEEGCDVLIMPTSIGIAPLLPSSPETKTNDASESSTTTTRTVFSTSSTSSSTSSKSDISHYLQDLLTVPASLAGLPALSVPMGVSTLTSTSSTTTTTTTNSTRTGIGKEIETDSDSCKDEAEEEEGWPIGIQVIGQWGEDWKVLEVGEAMMTMKGRS